MRACLATGCPARKGMLNKSHMNTPVLNDNLRAATEALCNLLAKEDKVVASKAK